MKSAPYKHAPGLEDAVKDSKAIVFGNWLHWSGFVQPNPTSPKYKISIKYEFGGKHIPVVEVLEPKLKLHPGTTRLPHTYGGVRLCLYRPSKNEWNEEQLMSETILRWATAWLAYYEFWFETGEWLGGGEHPDLKAA